ncbi:hypothetical protein CFIMG_008353RA00001 [Ceratocystis fimbriata CBS 114723]|uniref:Uncharacterized protein n=1 Tax=Ceratocystis fimbriata CBS 114723 TaxID=1035309 RepID=A0A2C5X423_9PEZI|nr:hypothetical protein CFIMG_008353RA00001 [Ceratocystis fimbriata CBS 114723]
MFWDIFTTASTGHEPMSTLLWSYYIHNSPYSPLNLSSLRQPTPNDAGASTPPDTFTFADAFEDLLAVSASQPMMPTQNRIEMRSLMRQVFPTTGEPPAFWLQRMDSAGLLAPNARHFFTPDQSHPFFTHSDGTDGWKPSSGGLLDNADLFRKEFERATRDLATSEDDVKKAGQALEELAGLWTSAFETGAKSFGTFVDMVRHGAAAISSDLDVLAKNKDTLQVTHTSNDDRKQADQSKYKTIESKDEYIDWMDMLHTKTTTKTLDENGNTVSSQSSWSMTNNYDKEKYKHLKDSKGNNTSSGEP